MKGREPIASGGLRLIYEHPADPDFLVKVMRPEAVGGRYGAEGTWWRRMRRHGPYILFVREIREYLAARAQGGGYAVAVQKITGLVDTDMGMGMVVAAARGADGKLAPTAAKLIFQGDYDAKAVVALDEFCRLILDSNVVLADLHERNIVYTRMKDGSDRFVMIDGLGSSTIIPFKAWFPTINRRSKAKRIERLRKRIAGRVAAYEAGSPMP